MGLRIASRRKQVATMSLTELGLIRPNLKLTEISLYRKIRRFSGWHFQIQENYLR